MLAFDGLLAMVLRTSDTPGATSRRTMLEKSFLALHWLNLAVIVLLAVAIRQEDAAWWGTMLALSPHWPLGSPLALLIPAALVLGRWRLFGADCIAFFLLLGPIMGMSVSGLTKDCPSTNGLDLRVLSCNLGGGRTDLRLLRDLITVDSPDVVAFQECPDSVPHEVFGPDWFIARQGSLCVVSRYPIEKSDDVDRRPFGGWGTVAIACRIATPDGPFDFVNVHLATARPGLEAVIDDKAMRLVLAAPVYYLSEPLATAVLEQGSLSRTNVSRDCGNMLRVVKAYRDELGWLGGRYWESHTLYRWAACESDPRLALKRLAHSALLWPLPFRRSDVRMALARPKLLAVTIGRCPRALCDLAPAKHCETVGTT